MMLKFLRELPRDEDGVTAVEYALVALLVMIGIVVSVQYLGGFVSKSFNTVGSSINTTVH